MHGGLRGSEGGFSPLFYEILLRLILTACKAYSLEVSLEMIFDGAKRFWIGWFVRKYARNRAGDEDGQRRVALIG